jgi:isopenicillin N synthase-like dioxygenase
VRKGVPFHGPTSGRPGAPEFRQAMEAYFAAVHRLAGQVTAAVAVALELPEDYFEAGRWIDADPVPGTFVVNVGDMLARWTNDLFPPTQHRVINTSGLDRPSIPFFYDPNHDAPVEVIGTCLAEGEQPRYPPTTSTAHLQERFGATLPYLDETLVDREQSPG